jgi:hypothetical protein
MNYDAFFFPLTGFFLIATVNIIRFWNRPIREYLKSTGMGIAGWFVLWLFLLIPGDPIGY